jgi:hypothetical protein
MLTKGEYDKLTSKEEIDDSECCVAEDMSAVPSLPLNRVKSM